MIMKGKLRFIGGIVFTIPSFFLFFSGCGVVLSGRYYDVRQPGEAVNPTSYDFDFSRSKIIAALDSCFNDRDYGREKESHQLVKGLRVTYWKEQINLMTCMPPEDGYRSYVYRKKKTDEKLSQSYSLLFDVDSVNPNKARVTVRCQWCYVYAGDYFLFNSHSMNFRAPRYLELGSTTIEEYEVLLILGKQLGQQGMPPVRYPRMTRLEDVQANFKIGGVQTLPFSEEDMLFGK